MACILWCFRDRSSPSANEQNEDEMENLFDEHAFEEYVQGDEDDSAVASLYHSDSAPDLKHELSLTLPREKWVDCVMQRSSSEGSDPASTEEVASPPFNANDSDYWRRVARKMMNFKLGECLDNPDYVVVFEGDKEQVEADLILRASDAERAYDQIKGDIDGWIQRRISRTPTARDDDASVQMRTLRSASSRRCTMSGKALISPKQYASRRDSPKMFLDDPDDELRTFVGLAECGVPLIRVNLLRCSESATHTKGVIVNGLLVVDVTLASQIQALSFTYTKWIIEDIVNKFLIYFDFIRLSNRMRDMHGRVVDALLSAGSFRLHKMRIIRFSSEKMYVKRASVDSSSRYTSRLCDFSVLNKSSSCSALNEIELDDVHKTSAKSKSFIQ